MTTTDKIGPRQVLLGLLAAGIVHLLFKVCSVEKKANNLELSVKTVSFTHPTPSITPYVRPVPSVDPVEEADLKHHHESIARCNAEKKTPVMGYGWRIVCIDPKFISWQEGPITGP